MYYSSHYAQAYSRASSSSLQNPAYNPQNENSMMMDTRLMSSWYQAGNSRCSHPGCLFMGSLKSVEIHMMDRHLIYPPGWDKRKNQYDWDADPSLKGKPILIQGTNVILDSPEVLNAWIAERKRRFPTSSRVQDKKRKLKEAVACGQLDFSGRDFYPNKLQKSSQFQRRNRDEPNNKVPDSGWSTRLKQREKIEQPPPKLSQGTVPSVTTDFDVEADDEEPEIQSSKLPPPSFPTSAAGQILEEVVEQSPIANPSEARERNRRIPLKPKILPRNPLFSRPPLLQNLLRPEIRVTVSNLSQAIRFLANNDFLRDVELKPGQSEEIKIQFV